VFVVQEIRVVKVWTFHTSRSTFRDCEEFLNSSLFLAPLKTLKALSQSFGHHMRDGFPGFPSDGRGETVSLWILDIERSHGLISTTLPNALI
jgi:hypothetical protein